MNKVIINGRTGRKPEIRNTQGGTMVANFSVAVSESYKDKQTGEWKENTDWINCSAFGKTAEYIDKYIGQGDRVSIVGRLKQHNWTDKDGNNRSALDVNVEQIEKWDWKKNDNVPSNDATKNEPVDDLPF